MGIASRLRDIRPPLPAPTDSMDEGGTTSGIETDVATNVTTRTDKSSYEIPEDGSPITIPTTKIASKKEGAVGGSKRDKSQTSLLIEYFEGSNTGDRTKAKPTVRVKVSQGSKRRSTSGANDAVQITGIGKDRKPSYTQRISLGSSRNFEIGAPLTNAGDPDSTVSNLSGSLPVEIEVLDHNNESDLSTRSRGLVYAPVESNVSSMPPESMYEGSEIKPSERSRSLDYDDDVTIKDGSYLREPEQDRNRSASKERIAQKVMEKLGQSGSRPITSGKSRSERSLGKEYDRERYMQGSDISNNPKLLRMVEDTIRNTILPEIHAAKEDQKSGRSPRSAEGSRRGSLLDNGLARRVSKSSSSPNIASKPKVVLNKDGDDPGTLLSLGDSGRRRRKSSRESYTEERPRSKKSNHSLRDAGAASLGAGILTAANLKQHEAQGDTQERRKRRSKSRGSRSRSAGLNETGDDGYLSKEIIPPMPLASNINDSEITRDSIVSAGTEKPKSRDSRVSAELRTPVREVSRGSLGDARSSPMSSRTPSRTSGPRNLGMSFENLPITSPKGSSGRRSTKNRHVDADGYGDSPTSQRKISSPVQSVSSLKKNFEDDSLVPKELRPRSAASSSPTGRLREKGGSRTSLQSATSSPLTREVQIPRSGGEYAARGLSKSPGTPNNGESIDDWYERQHKLNDKYRRSLSADSAQRDSFAAATNRDSYQTNPYPQDEKRWTMFTDDSQADPTMSEHDLLKLGSNPAYIHTPHGAESAVASLMEPSSLSSGSPTKSYSDGMSTHLRDLGKDTPPMYQGSTLSQTMPSQDRWTALKTHARNVSGSNSQDDVRDIESPRQSPARSLGRSQGGTPVLGASGLPVAHDPLPEIGHFDDSKSDVTTTPSVVEGRLGGEAADREAWPYTPEPISPPQRDLSSKDSRSLKSGQGGKDGLMAAAAAGTAALSAGFSKRQATVEDEVDERRLTPDISRRKPNAGSGRYSAMVDNEPEERSLTPDTGRRNLITARGATPTSPPTFGDEGYVTDARARSAGSLTPQAEQNQYNKADVEEFNRAMDAQDVDDDDDVLGADIKRDRHTSGNSHGMASPLYDSATGRGIDNIQSKDIVALMDHLTVRDAQRNARDTEILVTLVRSATEMRHSFDEMKRFIVEQDRMIMQNTDRTADSTAQKVMGGPRQMPARSTGTLGRQSEEDIQTKRKGVLRRALKGLTGGKSANDLAKVEGMLNQILENVEDLKHQGVQREPLGSYTNDSLDTYEQLRNAPDSGYEPEGLAGTSSTPSPSEPYYLPPRTEKQQFHSGYDGRRGSMNRVSTVLEGDEDDLEQHDERFHNDRFENDERLLTPTQELYYQQRGLSPVNTPPQKAPVFGGAQEDITPRSADQQRKHQSNNSSTFGVPKVSRWSKTTSSSAAPDPANIDSPNITSRNQKALSESSRSGSSLARYDDEEYALQDDDRLRSTQSLAREQDAGQARSIRSQVSKFTRTPSPLIPSEVSAREVDEYEARREESPIQEDLDSEFDDPKYQAVRNSLLLQHPQPRQGTTPRHQNTLESQAHQFDDTSGTNSDVSQKTVSDFDPATWGSSGTAGLAKHRLSQLEPLSPVSMGSPAVYGSSRGNTGDAPLVPLQQRPPIPPKIPHENPEPDFDDDWEREPLYSNSGFSRGGYYSSPYGSGHLLEPIEEVRYSLETDRHISPDPEIAAAHAVKMRSPARKITGPRPMGGRSVSGDQAKLVGTAGTVRRKPVGT